jgi:putative FmdB family regulatory protein
VAAPREAFLKKKAAILSPNQTRISIETNEKDQEVSMPTYDYICNDCHKTFEQALTLDEHDHQHVKCPKCGSRNVEQEAAAFFAVTSKKS